MAKAKASAEAIQRLSSVLQETGGREEVAEKYVDAFGNISKDGTTTLLPSNVNDPSSMVASALSIFGNIQKQNSKQVGRITDKSSNKEVEGMLGEYTLDSFDTDSAKD